MKIEKMNDRFERIDNTVNEKLRGVIYGDDNAKRVVSANAPIRKKVLSYINDNPGVSRKNLETFLANNGIGKRWTHNNKDYVCRDENMGFILTKLGKSALDLYNKYDEYKQELRNEIRDEIMKELTADAITHMNVSIFEDLTSTPRHTLIKAERLIDDLWITEKDDSINEYSETQKEEINEELSELQKKYHKYFNDLLKKFDAESPKDLTDDEKREFFNTIKDGWIKSV